MPKLKNPQPIIVFMRSIIVVFIQIQCFVRLTIYLTIVLGQSLRDLELNAKVQLVGGLNDREGIVLLTYDGVTGKLCDNGFDRLDAAVLCRMLSFT